MKKSTLISLGVLIAAGTLESTAYSQVLPGDINDIVKKSVTPGAAACDSTKTKPVKVAVSVSDFATEQMIKAAYPFYNKPYANDPSDYTTQGDLKVYRPNHGIAHAVRSAALGADLVSLIVANPLGGEMQSWLKAKISADPLFIKKVSMMALLHRSGREDEADSKGGPPEKREREMSGSVNNFKAAAANSGIHFT